MTVSGALDRLPRRLEGWAQQRLLSPVSVTGIALALCVCAAGWYSAGTPAGTAGGGAALGAGYLAWRGAVRLARPVAGTAAVTLVRVGGTASSFVICAGLAAGGAAAHLAHTWELAAAALIVTAIHDLGDACRGGTVVWPGGGAIGRTLRALLGFPVSGRVALAAVVTPLSGPRLPLLLLLGWAVMATGYEVTGPRLYRAVARAPEADWEDAVIVMDLDIPESLAAMMEEDDEDAGRAAVATPPDSRLPAITRASRDDGPVALRLGRAVRGQIAALPPAFAGLAATGLLAWLGLRDLPGPLLLTPLVVMLLAGFGSAHPHDRPLDWLTPAVLLGGQLAYTAAVGFAFGVPPPLTFGVCSLIALRCLALGGCGGPAPGPGWRWPRLGWEGRMLFVGVGAMAGIAVVAYVAAAAALAGGIGALVWPRPAAATWPDVAASSLRRPSG